MKKKNDKNNKESLNSVVGEIFTTTDGFFNDKPRIKKKRRVAALEQRKDDGAVVVAKIMSKEGKEANIGKDYIPDLVLKPEDHPSLDKESIVERRAQFGVKRKNAPNPKPIYPDDLERTGDKLTELELQKVRKGVQNDSSQHRKTFRKTLKSWFNNFKKK